MYKEQIEMMKKCLDNKARFNVGDIVVIDIDVPMIEGKLYYPLHGNFEILEINKDSDGGYSYLIKRKCTNTSTDRFLVKEEMIINNKKTNPVREFLASGTVVKELLDMYFKVKCDDDANRFICFSDFVNNKHSDFSININENDNHDGTTGYVIDIHIKVDDYDMTIVGKDASCG